MKLYKAGIEMRPPGVVLADVLRQADGAYETTTPLTEKFRDYIGEAAALTSDDERLRIAEFPEVPVSLENCRKLDPQTRLVMFCRLNTSPAETPRWRRITLGGRARYESLSSYSGGGPRSARDAYPPVGNRAKAMLERQSS